MGNVGNSGNNYNKYIIEQDNTRVYKPPIIQGGDNVILGSSDRSIWEREDDLIFNTVPLKKGLTDKQAEEFAKKNIGAEIIIREEDGTYSVYSIKTSEEEKTIDNKDFENINVINITKDVLNIVGGKKAYISTSDNTFRTFDKASFSLDFLEDDFISTDLNLNLQDIDGIDTSSKKDIKGSLNGNITIDKDLIKYSLQNAENETGVDFDLQADTKNNQYIVKCYYGGVSIGDLSITPTSTGLKLNVSGLAANAKYVVGGATLGIAGLIIADNINVGKIVEGITNNFAKDMGFKVKSNSDTEYILEPDFKSNALLKEIPLKDENKIKIEEINVNPNDIKMKLDEYGNLKIDIYKSEVIASTNPNGQIATEDKEGSDNINIKLKGELRNDFQSKINTTTNLNINITEQEKQAFQNEIKKYTGKDISASGEFKLKDVKIEATLEGKDLIKLEGSDGYFEAKKLNIDNNGTKININSATGNLKASQDGDNTILNSTNATINGSVKTGNTTINITKLDLSGDFIYNKNKPSEIIFNADKEKGIIFNGSIASDNGKTTLNNFSLKDSKLKIDQNTLNITPNSHNANIRATSILLSKTSNIQGLRMNGKLNVDLNTGNFNLDAKNLSLSANFDNLQVKYLNGSGNVSYDGSSFSINNANINSSMKIGEFEITKINGQGDVKVKDNGTLEFANTKNLEVETNIGLKAKGNLNITYDKENKNYNILSTVNPVEINFKSNDGLTVINEAKFEGEAKFNDNTKELTLSTYQDKSLQIKNANINGGILDNTSLTNAILKLDTQTGSFTVNPLSQDKNFTFNSSINGIDIQNLESNSNITYNSKDKIVSWDKDVKMSIPNKNIEYIRCSGQNSLKFEDNGNIILNTNGSNVSAKFGNIEIQDLKLDGQIIYDAKNQTISIRGNSDNEFKFEGKINGKDISILSSGTFSMKDLGEKLEFVGENIKVNGVLDGFNIQSPEGNQGKLVVSKDFTKIDLKELRCNINIEGMNINNENGLINFSEEGLNIDLSGNVNLKQEQLFSLLDKLSKNDLVGETVKKTVKQSIDMMNQNFNKFGDSNISYDKFSIKTDKDFNLLNVEFETNANIKDIEAKVILDENKSPSPLHLGDVTISMNGRNDGQNTIINNGKIEFNFNEKLRKEVGEMVKKELEKNGFKDINLEISPKGDVTVNSATYVIKKNALQKEKVKGVKMKFHVDMNIENNKVNITLDQLRMKNIFIEAINGVAGGKKIALDQVEKGISTTGIELERKSRNQISIDLNSISKTYFDNNLLFKDVKITDQGNILINYEYGSHDQK